MCVLIQAKYVFEIHHHAQKLWGDPSIGNHHNVLIISNKIYFHYKTDNKNHKSPETCVIAQPLFFNNTEQRETAASDLHP